MLMWVLPLETAAMADPKYANLPGIAYDQPDVYETSDLPEAEQAVFEKQQDENESVERLHLNAGEAFNTFKDKLLDTSKTDFSDRISQRRRIGYDAFSMEYEMLGEGYKEPETPQQKYQRLQHEIQQLMEEINNIKEDAKVDSQQKQNAMSLAKAAEDLHLQLQNLKLEQTFGTEILKNINDPQGSLQKKLLSEIENFKQISKSAVSGKPESKPSSSESSKDHVVYELHYKPELTKLKQDAKIISFEKRLQNLELILGATPEKMASLASDTNHLPIVESVSLLNSKLNLLEPAHIDQVDAHLAALSLRLSQLADKKNIVEDADKLSKVSELYELLKKTEIICSELPDIVTRMVALRDLHEQAVQFSVTLTQLDAAQEQITAGLKHNQEVLTVVQKEFAKNMDTIKENITSLDNRISALKK